MNAENQDQPATKRDLREALSEFKTYVVERENAFFWKIILLQVTLIGAISAGQWAVLTYTLQHWKP
jgi:hypothetical protein